MTLKNIEKQSITEYWNALYEKDGREFFIVFTHDYDYNNHYGQREVVNIESNGEILPGDDPVWDEVRKLVSEYPLEPDDQVSFAIRINREWLSTLRELCEDLQHGASPEEAVENMIFSQLLQQLESTL